MPETNTTPIPVPAFNIFKKEAKKILSLQAKCTAPA
ncbi:MAG: hypothetical protein HW421_3112 [Ignavibacteria bacterium]|nr:hypothetical protein [Ignavibacteria bacterium]